MPPVGHDMSVTVVVPENEQTNSSYSLYLPEPPCSTLSIPTDMAALQTAPGAPASDRMMLVLPSTNTTRTTSSTKSPTRLASWHDGSIFLSWHRSRGLRRSGPQLDWASQLRHVTCVLHKAGLQQRGASTDKALWKPQNYRRPCCRPHLGSLN